MRHFIAALVIVSVAGVGFAETTTLHFTSYPAGAKIYLQGYFKGVTPAVVALQAATAAPQAYRVSLIRAGYQKWTGTLTMAAGQHKSLTATLKAEAPAPVSLGRLSGKVICIDPGHPSETSGGTKGKKITEVRANWLVAGKLKTLLQQAGARVVMTKVKEGEHVTNRRRAEIANAAGADLMVRLHCDCAGGPGLAVYYPDRQGTKFGVTGPSSAIISASRVAAKAFYPVAIAALKGKVAGRGLHGDSGTYVGSKQGALTGSIFAKIPVFTVEMVTLTHKSDDDFMSGDAGQLAMAKAILAGIAAAVR